MGEIVLNLDAVQRKQGDGEHGQGGAGTRQACVRIDPQPHPAPWWNWWNWGVRCSRRRVVEQRLTPRNKITHTAPASTPTPTPHATRRTPHTVRVMPHSPWHPIPHRTSRGSQSTLPLTTRRSLSTRRYARST